MLADLRVRYPWPERPPDVAPDAGPEWFVDDQVTGHTAVLQRLLGPETRVLLELGSFAGRSTRCLLRICPQAQVVAIDTWLGSREHWADPALHPLLSRLYETFLVNLWEYRDRLIPLRTTTQCGIEQVHAAGINVDAIYLDADHSSPAVIDDLTALLRCFPNAQIIGDDWNWPSVQRAVVQVARQTRSRLRVQGNLWWFAKREEQKNGERNLTLAERKPATVVCLTLFRRPDYTRRVIESLARCDGIEDHLVVFHVEPGDREVLRLAREAPLEKKQVIENSVRLGCNVNTYTALDHAFQLSDFVIHLEDDTVPARDCLRYFQWARRYQRDSEVFSVAAYGKSTPPPSEYYAVRRVAWFTPWGWATWSDRWAEIRERWHFDAAESWDLTVNRLRGRRVQLEPRLARIQNIGAEGGAYCPGPDWHRANQFHEFGAWSIPLDPQIPFSEAFSEQCVQ